jgi:hypothetical protein
MPKTADRRQSNIDSIIALLSFSSCSEHERHGRKASDHLVPHANVGYVRASFGWRVTRIRLLS